MSKKKKRKPEALKCHIFKGLFHDAEITVKVEEKQDRESENIRMEYLFLCFKYRKFEP